jgi:hypothetical protein
VRIYCVIRCDQLTAWDLALGIIANAHLRAVKHNHLKAPVINLSRLLRSSLWKFRDSLATTSPYPAHREYFRPRPGSGTALRNRSTILAKQSKEIYFFVPRHRKASETIAPSNLPNPLSPRHPPNHPHHPPCPPLLRPRKSYRA